MQNPYVSFEKAALADQHNHNFYNHYAKKCNRGKFRNSKFWLISGQIFIPSLSLYLYNIELNHIYKDLNFELDDSCNIDRKWNQRAEY
jgi:hypothetical protein